MSLVVSGEFIAGDLVKFYFLREYPDIYQELYALFSHKDKSFIPKPACFCYRLTI